MSRHLGPLLLASIIAVIITASTLAYTASFPDVLGAVAHADKLLHFTIFGTLAFAVLLTWGDVRLHVGRLSIPLAVAVPLALAATEEFLQSLSPHRSCDVLDLLSDATGMLIAWLIFRKLRLPTRPAARRISRPSVGP